MAHSVSVSVIAAGAGSQTVQVSVPPDAIALSGLSWNGIGTFTRHIAVEIRTLPEEGHKITGFLAFRGRKSALGTFPMRRETALQVSVTVATADAALTYDVVAVFLVPDKGDQAVFLPAVPFQVEGGPDCIVAITATSGANAAQTVDVAALGNMDAIQPVAAHFYTSAGTSTGETDHFDATTAVTIDSTAAVAEYTFNLGAKGSQLLIADPVSQNNQWRTVIGTAGAGNTSTLVLIYRAVLLR